MNRKKLFKIQYDVDSEELRKVSREAKKIKKEFQKNIDDMKAMKKEEAKRQDIAWNLIVNHAKDSIAIHKLSQIGINI